MLLSSQTRGALTKIPPCCRPLSHANGAGGRRNAHQLTDEDDFDDFDLEDGPLLNRCNCCSFHWTSWRCCGRCSMRLLRNVPGAAALHSRLHASTHWILPTDSLQGCRRDRQAFEVQGYQGSSDSAAYAAASGVDSSSASILGGAYAPAEQRRRCCAAVLSVLAALLIVAALAIGGFGLYSVSPNV